MRTPRTARRDKSGSYARPPPPTGGGLASFQPRLPAGSDRLQGRPETASGRHPSPIRRHQQSESAPSSHQSESVVSRQTQEVPSHGARPVLRGAELPAHRALRGGSGEDPRVRRGGGG